MSKITIDCEDIKKKLALNKGYNSVRGGLNEKIIEDTVEEVMREINNQLNERL